LYILKPTTRLAGGLLSAYKAVGAGCAYWRIEKLSVAQLALPPLKWRFAQQLYL